MTYTLQGGPQDGGKVTSVNVMPDVIWVGPRPLGDGFVAWSREKHARFPCAYVLIAGQYLYSPR